jgi:sensor histidine kinase YesM
MYIQKEKTHRVLQHIGFWVVYIFVFGSVFGKTNNDYFWLFLSALAILPVQMLMVYFTNYFLVKIFFRKQEYVKFFISTVLLLFIITPLARIIIFLMNDLEFNLVNFFSLSLFYYYLESGICVFAALSIKLFKERNKEVREKELIEKQKIEAELVALKSQLDAHFLFNTLNTLYGLARKKSDLTPKGILMLSDMLSFMLYECKANYYPLSKELELIQNYIELQKLRFGNKISILFDKSKNNHDCLIAPLLLFNFIENSLKHCSAKPNAPLWIKISVLTNSKELVFIVENSVDSSIINSNINGIGFENTHKRLKLLHPNNHNINVDNRKESFYICVKIYHNIIQ